MLKMVVTVIGLGLIGGSFCKAIKEKTSHKCLGFDINENVLQSAISTGAIDGIAKDFSEADLTIVCLYPEAALSFMLENAEKFKKGSLVMDACGIKSEIVKKAHPVLSQRGIFFIGAHPMAGREFSGFEYSTGNLFENASFIITPTKDIPEEKIKLAKDFANALGFKRTVVSTPEEHDAIIAYTSQLAHVVSNAYIKSPTLSKEMGFSAGSFKDLTRVAKLNEDMWTSLFMLNREPLLFELDVIIENLKKYKDALEKEDSIRLKELLREGRILKELSLEREKKD
jgi:prephenate dehydrogenase